MKSVFIVWLGHPTILVSLKTLHIISVECRATCTLNSRVGCSINWSPLVAVTDGWQASVISMFTYFYTYTDIQAHRVKIHKCKETKFVELIIIQAMEQNTEEGIKILFLFTSNLVFLMLQTFSS